MVSSRMNMLCYVMLCQNIGGNKFSHTGDSPKWVKSKRQGEKGGEKLEERIKVANSNGNLRIATPPRVAHAMPPGPKNYQLI